MKNKFFKIVQIKSTIGKKPKHRATILCLGLKKIGSISIVKNTKSIRGMMNLVSYMIKFEEFYENK
ncbi:50S ribosomal protein L30 [bacterium endosymbiont of Pedicinus badii]|uniref:50S ribosomal protein L30 n=1 Tax=bacterium endosymbiont of Pedicinus badii TaxID=1719126 RepID=UPI0009BBB02E|nr:50S ribosomal protein L30 [bacterium endosymbiont of Pedicinus badii]OQM34269.1 50S ribosomal protein L30 [bacterium endosymbiont of Pedicinus badii]